MPRRFYKDSKPGIDLTEAMENPSIDKTEIVEVDESGTEKARLPYLPGIAYRLRPEDHPQYLKRKKVVTKTGEVEIPTRRPENKLNIGENPFIQLIYNFTRGNAPVTKEEIIRYLIQEKKVLPDDKNGRKRAQKYIHTMHDGQLAGLLLKKNKSFHPGIKPKVRNNLITLHIGYDPITYEIFHYISRKGSCSRDEIHTYMCQRIKWVRNPSTVDRYLKHMTAKNLLQTVGKNWYETKKQLEPYD